MRRAYVPLSMVLRTFIALSVASGGVGPLSGQESAHSNLQVLPSDISESELSRVMLANLAGLGLPRRGGQGCLFCHVGDMDMPRSEWDFASDDKVQKRKARKMLAMMAEINERLAGLEERVAPDLEVTCHTCHKGRTDPRSLTDLMIEAYRATGVDSAIAVYRDLRARYFGGDAYDFRPRVLLGLANAAAVRGAYEDALALSRLNEEFHPGDKGVRRGTLILKIGQDIEHGGVEAGLARFERARASEPPGTITLSVLDNIGWALFRTERQEEALRLFRRNIELFGDSYVPNESLAQALFSSGERDAGLGLLQEWVDAHPEDDVARRVLINMRARGG